VAGSWESPSAVDFESSIKKYRSSRLLMLRDHSCQNKVFLFSLRMFVSAAIISVHEKSSTSSSSSPSLMESSESSCDWFPQSLSEQRSVHFNILDKQIQLGSSHFFLHLHASNCSTASSAGFPSIQSICRTDTPSVDTSIVQPMPSGLGISGSASRLRLQIPEINKQVQFFS